MVCRLTIGRKAYAAAEPQIRKILTEATDLRTDLRRLVDDDAAAYEKVSAAYKIPKDSPQRARAIDEALVGASDPPLQGARRAARVYELAQQLDEIGNKNARSDAAVARHLAIAAIRGMIENARINLDGLTDKTLGLDLAKQMGQLAARVGSLAG
jgi:formiminotetrahydrofolate cyclodeaminase